MSTGTSWKHFGAAFTMGLALLCAAPLSSAVAAEQAQSGQHAPKKTKKQEPSAVVLPSGPTGVPVPQIPLDVQPAVPPQVSYQNNELTIVAPNSTLADILRAVRKQTGAEIEIPAAPERVVTHLGPGPARDVVAELLNGSRFNYVLLGSPADEATLTRVVLVAKTGPQDIIPPPPGSEPGTAPQAAMNNAPQPAEQMQDNEQDTAEENADDNADQPPAEAEQQQAQPQDQNQVRTPQQMLQEMQQRQMQMQQQQQQPGQPPLPPAGRPPVPQPQNQ
jgi:hypothetical protein